jgi:hypothetical protein
MEMSEMSNQNDRIAKVDLVSFFISIGDKSLLL